MSVRVALLCLLVACGNDKPSPLPGTHVTDERVVLTDKGPEKVVSVEKIDHPDPATVPEAQRGAAFLDAGRDAEAEDLWYRQCGAGTKAACGELAYQYANPYVAPKMPHAAEHQVEILTKACDLHAQPVSCALLADAYRNGTNGFAKDEVRARDLLKTACDDGHYWSCDALKSAR